VHSEGFEDTKTPKVIALFKENYPDSVLVTYFTDRLKSRCFFMAQTAPAVPLNTTLYKPGVTDEVREYKLWHVVELVWRTIGSDLGPRTSYHSSCRCAMSMTSAG